LAVEQHILTAAFHWVDELERQATTANDGDVCQVPEPVPVRLEVTFVYAWYRGTDRVAVAGGHLRDNTTYRVQQTFTSI